MERLLPPISFDALRADHAGARAGRRHRHGGVSDCCSDASSECSSATSMPPPRGCWPRKAARCSFRRTRAAAALWPSTRVKKQDAIRSARRLIDAFEKIDVDTIVINAAGCGSAMKRYGHLLRKDPEYAERAKAFSAKCRDISEVLVDLEPRAPRGRIDTARGVSRRLPSAARAGRPGAAAHAAAGHSGRGSARRGGIGDLLRLRRHLQHARAGGGHAAARSQGGEHHAH